MKKYLGSIYVKSKPKKKNFWTRFFGNTQFVSKFSDCIIEAETYLEAHEKMKKYADEYIAKAKQMPNAGYMKNLIHESYVTEQI